MQFRLQIRPVYPFDWQMVHAIGDLHLRLPIEGLASLFGMLR
jgi:hypothetical protein